MSRIFDTDWDDWKPGDKIVWDEEPYKSPVTITEVDAYGRVFWEENGETHMTRSTNMLRVAESEEQT